MTTKYLIGVGISLLASTLMASSAFAEEGAAASPKPDLERRVFVGLSVGAAYAAISHPLVVEGGFSAPTLGAHAGYTVSERWTVGIELSTVEQTMTRDGAKDPFAPAGYLKPQAGCTNCEAPPVGGWLTKATAVFGTLGPRVEFAPMGRDGVYFGLSTGLGTLFGIDTQFGFGGGARAGYRVRIAKILGLAVEGGVQGQYFSQGTAVFPYASVMMRPYF